MRIGRNPGFENTEEWIKGLQKGKAVIGYPYILPYTVTASTDDSRLLFLISSGFSTGDAAPPATMDCISPSVVVYTSAAFNTSPNKAPRHCPSITGFQSIVIYVKSLDKILSIAAKNKKKFAMDWSSGWYLYSFYGQTGLKLGLNKDGVTNFCTWNSKKGEIIRL